MITQQDIADRLEFLKKDKNRRQYFQPEDYSKFMPETMGFQQDDTSMMDAALGQVGQRGQQATALVKEQANNTQELAALMRAREEKKRAQQSLVRARKNRPVVDVTLTPGQSQGGGVGPGRDFGNYTGERNFGKKWGKDNTPEVSDLKQVNPNAPVVGVNWRGKTFAVNRQVAPIFVALLDDLYAAGYRPVSIGGYNKRNIAGTNTPSLHSHGLAIDIDPHLNPVQHGSNNHALPANVASLAAKYGLSWGGSWSSYKDPMHFSVPYGGRE